jgi:DNA-binding transcriptional LysR family regulator
MGRIAWGRVIFCGIVAGVLFNAFEFLLHGRMLGVAWRSAMLALGKTEQEIVASQATSMPILLLWAFLACLFGVWLYAAIRPRFGSGPKTALLAAVATWFGVTLMPAMITVAYDLYPGGLVTTWVMGELVGLVVSIFIGAWLYREP